MKTLLLIVLVIALAAPIKASAIQEFKRTGEITTDQSGGYSESQRDPHARRAKQVKDKTGGGYYQGGYHSTSPEYKPGEWQFVEPSHGGSSHKSYKKVKETDKGEKKSKAKKESKKEKK